MTKQQNIEREKMKITQRRENDKINFYTQNGSCVATLFDGQDSIVFDELAYGPALLDGDIPGDHIERKFKRIGLDAYAARYIDAC